jgi:hypothetical protein
MGHRAAVDHRRRIDCGCVTPCFYPVDRPALGFQNPIRQDGGMPRLNLDRLRPRSQHLYALAMGSIGLCIALWMRAKTIGEDERGNAERRALFIGLWPPMFWLIGDALRRAEMRRARTSPLRRILR